MTLMGTERGGRILTTETPLSTKYEQGSVFIWKSHKKWIYIALLSKRARILRPDYVVSIRKVLWGKTRYLTALSGRVLYTLI